MREWDIYYDIDKQDKVSGPINFGPVLAGKTTSKNLYVYNKIKYPITFSFDLKDNDPDITLGNSFDKLNPGELKGIELIFSPKVTKMKPVEATLVANIKYIVE